jgi:hypothetical protein
MSEIVYASCSQDTNPYPARGSGVRMGVQDWQSIPWSAIFASQSLCTKPWYQYMGHPYKQMEDTAELNGQGAGGWGIWRGRTPLTRNFQMFSERAPVLGYGGWTNISCLAVPPPQQQHVRQIGEVAQPQHTVPSDEEQQQTGE